MAKEYLDLNGLSHVWAKIKAYLTNNVPVPSTTTPTMNGTASTGSETAFSRGDHVHPSDSSKVDKVTGKGLSSNDFTTALKNKLDGIETGAEVNVQVDWNETDSSSDAFIKNKPTIPSGITVDSALSSTSENPVQNKVINGALEDKVDKVTGKVLSSNDFTDALKNKLDGIASGATVDDHKWNDVQLNKSDYTTSTTGDCYVPFVGSVNGTGAYYRKATASASASGSKYALAKYNGDGRLSSVTPASGNSSTLVATTAFVSNAISGKISSSEKGAASGVCPLNASSKIDSSYLPSYVDDVVECYVVSGSTAFSAGWLSETDGGSALTPESGKIYVVLSTGDYYLNQYRWGGTEYVKLNDGGVSSITNAEIDAIIV